MKVTMKLTGVKELVRALKKERQELEQIEQGQSRASFYRIFGKGRVRRNFPFEKGEGKIWGL